MKKNILLFLFLLVWKIGFSLDTLKFSSLYVVPKEKVIVKYISESRLDTLRFYFYVGKGAKPLQVEVKNIFSIDGTYLMDWQSSIDDRLLVVQARDKDHKVVYNQSNTVQFHGAVEIEAESQLQYARSISRHYAHFLKKDINVKTAISIFEDQFLFHPHLEKEFARPYISNLLESPKSNVQKIKWFLAKYADTEEIDLLWLLANSYKEIGDMNTSSYFYEKIKEAYPCDQFITNNQNVAKVTAFSKLKTPLDRIRFVDNYRKSLGDQFQCDGNQFNFRWFYGQLYKDYEQLNQVDTWFGLVDALGMYYQVSTYQLTLSLLANEKGETGPYWRTIAHQVIAQKDTYLGRPRMKTEGLHLSDFEVLKNRKKVLSFSFVSLAQLYEKEKQMDSAYYYYDVGVGQYSEYEYADQNRKFQAFLRKANSADWKKIDDLVLKNQAQEPFLEILKKGNAAAEQINLNLEIPLINEEYRSLKITGLHEEMKLLSKPRIYVLNFWASWCMSCIAKFPSIDYVMNRFQDQEDVEILLVNTFENKSDEKVLEIIKNQGFDFPVYFNRDNELESIYQMNGLPYMMILDSKGRIRYKETGFQMGKTTSDIVSVIEKLRKE